MSASAAVSEKNPESETAENGEPRRRNSLDRRAGDTGLGSKSKPRWFEFLVFLSTALLVTALAFVCAECHVSRLERQLLSPAGQRSVLAEPAPARLDVRHDREGIL